MNNKILLNIYLKRLVLRDETIQTFLKNENNMTLPYGDDAIH